MRDLRDLLGEKYFEKVPHLDIGLYILISAGTGLCGYLSHQSLLDAASSFLSLSSNQPSSNTTYETSFFSLLSFVYGLFSGQTFLFLYERQVNVQQELYGEIFALESILELSFISCQDAEMRAQMARAVQLYVQNEIYTPCDMTSPFEETGPFMMILNTIAQLGDQEVDVGDLAEAGKHLAEAQSRRSAVASQILPDVHNVFMLAQILAIVTSFLVFDFSEEASGREERRLLFGALLSFLSLTFMVTIDLADPLNGLYSFRPNLDKRLGLLAKHLRVLEKGDDPNFAPKSVQTLSKLGILSFASSSPRSSQPKKRRVGLFEFQRNA